MAFWNHCGILDDIDILDDRASKAEEIQTMIEEIQYFESDDTGYFDPDKHNHDNNDWWY